MKSFTMSQLDYFLLILMNHNRSLNNEINGIHERELRAIYKDKKWTLKDLLEKHKTVTVPIKNLQVLVTKSKINFQL